MSADQSTQRFRLRISDISCSGLPEIGNPLEHAGLFFVQATIAGVSRQTGVSEQSKNPSWSDTLDFDLEEGGYLTIQVMANPPHHDGQISLIGEFMSPIKISSDLNQLHSFSNQPLQRAREIPRVGTISFTLGRLDNPNEMERHTLPPVVDVFMHNRDIDVDEHTGQTTKEVEDSENKKNILLASAGAETAPSSPEIPPEPLSIDIEFWYPSDLESTLNDSPEIEPEPLSHEIEFYSSDSEDSGDIMSSSAENTPELQSMEIGMYSLEDIAGLSNPAHSDLPQGPDIMTNDRSDMPLTPAEQSRSTSSRQSDQPGGVADTHKGSPAPPNQNVGNDQPINYNNKTRACEACKELRVRCTRKEANDAKCASCNAKNIPCVIKAREFSASRAGSLNIPPKAGSSSTRSEASGLPE